MGHQTARDGCGVETQEGLCFFLNVVLVGFIAWIPEIPISQSV